MQVYECSNGHYTYEFTFYDYLFELSKNANAKLTEKERQDQKNILEQEFNKSGLTKAEFSMMKRKTLREKGEFVPELPPYTAVERTHFHQLNSKANEEKFKKRQEMHQSGAK